MGGEVISPEQVNKLLNELVSYVNDIDPQTAMAIWTGDKAFNPGFYAAKYAKLVAGVEHIKEVFNKGEGIEDAIALLRELSPSTGIEKCAGNNAELAGIGRG